MRATRAVSLVLGLAWGGAGWVFSACSAESGPPIGGGGNSDPGNGYTAAGGTGGNSTGAGIVIDLPDANPVVATDDASGPTVTWPPPNFVNITPASIGDYAASKDPISGTGGSGGAGGSGGTSTGPAKCTNILFGVIRDFKMSTTDGGHPDFEQQPRDDRGIVADTLGSDGKPVYANPGGTTPTTHGQSTFDQWYRDVDGVNMTYVVGLHFVQNGSVYTFAATVGNSGGVGNVSYFPLDGLGFGNQNQTHNYSFTTEIHTAFTYNGGETFTFQGDDDVWVFINNKLAIDLGGIHAQETQTVSLDAQASKLGISKGNSYPLAVFNAERHMVQSNFRIDTTLSFDNCGIIPIPIL